MNSSGTSIAKLNGTSDYQVWSIKMKSYLIAQDLWEVVDVSPSIILTDKSMSQNSKALSFIILSCEDHIINLLDPNGLAVTAWKKLEKQYGNIGFSARHLAFQSLVSTNLSSCDNIDQYVGQFRSKVNSLSQMTSEPLPQWLLLSILLNNVGNRYEAWSQSVMQQVRLKKINDDSGYLDEIIASLIDEARRLGQNSDNNSSTAMTARKGGRPKPICKHCGKIHKSDNCWEMFPEKRPSARMSSSKPDSFELNNANESSGSIAFLSQNQNGPCDSWILDSGATQHMCNDQSQFLHLEPFSTTITTANNTKMHATGKGDVSLVTKNGMLFTLQNVLLVPQLASNLLSICYATRNPNIHFKIENEKCLIMFNKTLIATAFSQDSLLVLETIRTYAYNTKSVDTLTWHKRLGHVNKEYMNKGAIQSIVGNVGTFSCDTCLKNKSTRIISTAPVIKAKRPLEKIHSDLAGPITPISLGGNRYLVTFTDDFTRFSWVYPCKEKSSCFDIFKLFKRTIETEFNRKIAFLHCDNGGEYSGNEFKQFAKDEGMQIQYTVPHTPEQNGVDERLNRTLFNMTRCFLNDSSNLTKSLWAELVNTACFIKNRLPSSSNEKFKSPFEKLYERAPTLDHLRIIGSKCFCHKTGKICGKLEERSSESILVGYDSTNIYRVFDSVTNKVSRSRDVVICESYQSHSNSNQGEGIHHEEVNLDFNQVSINTPKQLSKQNVLPPAPLSSPPQWHTPASNFPRSDNNDLPYESSIDELADPRYDNKSIIARAFIAKCLAATESSDQCLPETLEQAANSDNGSQWKESMRNEMKSLMENKTWKLVQIPETNHKVIQGRWVFRTKTDMNGKITKYKSRWVVRGFQQEEGLEFTDTFASVVKPMSYKILFSIAASMNLDIEQMDVKTAFLNSPIDEEVYVEQPHGFEVASLAEEQTLKKELLNKNFSSLNTTPTFPKETKSSVKLVCKLDKALYGLKQAPRAWYETLSAFMQKSNLGPLKSDYAVFANESRSLLVAVYVDDILIFGKNKVEIQNLKVLLHNRFDMTDMGSAHMYLGMQISRNRTSNTITLDQRKYVQIVLDRFNMSNCNPVSTPMETGLKLGKRIDNATPYEKHEYQKIIGCLEYAAMATRPDITFAVHKLAQFSSNPDSSHFKAAKRILRYLKGSIGFCLVFKGHETTNFNLVGYSDADWAGNTSDRKSIGGYCFYLNGCLISHMSKKQKTIALSTAESETHAAVQATKEAIWLRNILLELNLKQIHPTTIFCDNQAAIALSRNPEFHSRSKHVDIQYHFLRQHVDIKTVDLRFIGSDDMAADGLTKSLSRYKHNRFCDFMQGKIIKHYP